MPTLWARTRTCAQLSFPVSVNPSCWVWEGWAALAAAAFTVRAVFALGEMQ